MVKIMMVNIEKLISKETERLSNKFGKCFLDCEEVQQLTGLGRDNARALFRNKAFPVTRVGRRQVVSIINFVRWQFDEYHKGGRNIG